MGDRRRHDLVIVGRGSGNMVIDSSFAGLDVAIVGEGPFGGTCLNYGCIPSKMLAYTAEVARTVGDAARYDVDATLRGVHWRQVRDRVFGRVDAESADGREGREKSAPPSRTAATVAVTTSSGLPGTPRSRTGGRWRTATDSARFWPSAAPGACSAHI